MCVWLALYIFVGGAVRVCVCVYVCCIVCVFDAVGLHISGRLFSTCLLWRLQKVRAWLSGKNKGMAVESVVSETQSLSWDALAIWFSMKRLMDQDIVFYAEKTTKRRIVKHSNRKTLKALLRNKRHIRCHAEKNRVSFCVLSKNRFTTK